MAAPKPAAKGTRPLVGLAILGTLTVAGALGWWGWQAFRPDRSDEAESPAAVRGRPVRLATVTTATFEDSSTFVGTLAAERAAEIRTEVPGRLQQLFVSEGQSVDAGAQIAQLSPEKQRADLDSARANVRAATAARDRAIADLAALEAERATLEAEVRLQESQLERISGLAGEGAIAAQQFDLVVRDLDVARANRRALERRIEAARAQLVEATALLEERQATAERDRRELQETTLTAPFAGTVGTISARVGDFLAGGDRLASLVADGTLELQLFVPVERGPELYIGLPVRIIDAAGGTLAAGRIGFVSPQVEAQSQFILAKARFQNPASALRSGQFVRAEAIWETRRQQPVVPAGAIAFQGDDRYAYVASADGTTVERRLLEVGLTEGERVEIRSGLVAGDRVVVSGIQGLQDGSAISPVAGE